MGKKQYISYQDKHGNAKFREATTEELAAIAPQSMTWHYTECPLRITFSDETKHTWLAKYQENELLGTYPDISALLDYVKGMTDRRVAFNGETHIYLEEIYADHKAIVEKYGGVIEYKPIN